MVLSSSFAALPIRLRIYVLFIFGLTKHRMRS